MRTQKNLSGSFIARFLTVYFLALVFSFISVGILNSCQQQQASNKTVSAGEFSADPELLKFIGNIKAVDNHTHVNTVDSNDTGADALPLDLIFPFELPERFRPTSPDWLAAYKALYEFTGTELTEEKMNELIKTTENVRKEKGEKFPEWVLDKSGIEVMVANRLAMGPGLTPPRFIWASYGDALLYPLSTKAEAAVSPDRQKLFPLEDQLLRNFLTDLKLPHLPASLTGYLKQVVTPTLESQKQRGCIAVKFEVAYLRALDFDEVQPQKAAQVYSHYVNGGEPSHAEYKALQDFLFRYVAREAGRLGMAVHIHSFHAAGNFYSAAGSDPLLLEPALNDTSLRNTKFVIIHGGGAFYNNTSMLLWKPNVYADISAMTRIYTASYLAMILRDWLSQFPEKVLFGTDAATFGPGMGWEVGAWIAAETGRKALAIALTEMMKNDEVSRSRAQEIATMVMRGNASNLYNLNLK